MQYRRFKQGWEPEWRPPGRELRGELSPLLASWLIDTDSLTRRLRSECGGGFRVEVIEQRWQRPMFSERMALGLSDQVFALVRQVRLFCGEYPLVYARTVMPDATLKGARRRFAHLGNRPLGAMLFSDRRIVRNGMEVARIEPGRRLYRAAVGDGQAAGEDIWGRRSIFLIDGRPLLVSEIFLPAIREHG